MWGCDQALLDLVFSVPCMVPGTPQALNKCLLNRWVKARGPGPGSTGALALAVVLLSVVSGIGAPPRSKMEVSRNKQLIGHGSGILLPDRQEVKSS